MTVLRVAAVAELVTLVVLVANRVTAHVDAVTGLVGPLHGTAYLAVIGATLLLPVGAGVRLRALLPGVGGLLAVRAVRAAPGPPPRSA